MCPYYLFVTIDVKGDGMIVNKDLPQCPVATAVAITCNKWKLLILRNLLTDPLRFTDLLNCLEGISKKVLTESLHSLEDDGIVNRKTYPEEIPVKVEYSLSEIGETLKPIFDVLKDWGNNYKEFVKNTSENNGSLIAYYFHSIFLDFIYVLVGAFFSYLDWQETTPFLLVVPVHIVQEWTKTK